MSKCLVLFIGESFREGGQFSRIRNTKDSFEKQQIASLSQIDFLNYIKNKFSCNIDVIINTYTTIYENDLRYWYDQYLINYISNDKLIGLENLLNNGIKSINIDGIITLDDNFEIKNNSICLLYKGTQITYLYALYKINTNQLFLVDKIYFISLSEKP